MFFNDIVIPIKDLCAAYNSQTVLTLTWKCFWILWKERKTLWVLAFMQMLLWHIQPTLMARPFPNYIGILMLHSLLHCKNCSEIIWGTWQRFKLLNQPPVSPDHNLIKYLSDVLDKKIWSMEDPPHNLKD